MQELIRRFVHEESGATMVEYAIMVALIAVVAIATVVTLGGEVEAAFDNIVTTLQNPDA
ncbi:Flp family type IVb pilin [Thiohalorhabdus denitrificans]|uniref:Pilus assembly protein Flp/PilA n=1 Tax=Thiohalorhabdus denitrificans TaxID=381306 RepID=A0A1G5DM54_9GAMM|nr:Flp family type IVb pilin [Thiohalorhabdus denitrificans]SCY15829.1 pilus assembly protein Flp/PilA [Thiohalorhabdus denitrificans]